VIVEAQRSAACRIRNGESFFKPEESMLMGMPVNTPRAWRFGVFELDAATGELRRNGTVVRLREQPARILLLLSQPARSAACWPDLPRIFTQTMRFRRTDEPSHLSI
jgi:hypothetical protein